MGVGKPIWNKKKVIVTFSSSDFSSQISAVLRKRNLNFKKRVRIIRFKVAIPFIFILWWKQASIILLYIYIYIVFKARHHRPIRVWISPYLLRCSIRVYVVMIKYSHEAFSEEEEFFTCHIHNYTEYNSSEMCSLHLTHPSAHTPGAVGSRGAVGGSVPCSRVSPQSWTLPAGAKIRTHYLRLQVQRLLS